MFVNPHSRQGQDSGAIVQKWLLEKGYQVLNPSFDPKRDDPNLLLQEHKDTALAAIVGGGDGSVNHLLSGLMKSQVPLLLVPLGTANNLARTLTIPTDTLQSLELLETGKIEKIDVGFINEIPFVNVIGLGLSTQVNRLTRGEHKKFWGVFAFIWMALKVGLRMKPFRARIVCDGDAKWVRTLQISICNGRNYGSGLVIHEEAGLSDETLHGLSTEIKKFWQLFGLIPSLLLGRYRKDQEVSLFQGHKIEIETRRSMHIDVDGDLKTRTPAQISVVPRALSVYVPKTLKNI